MSRHTSDPDKHRRQRPAASREPRPSFRLTVIPQQPQGESRMDKAAGPPAGRRSEQDAGTEQVEGLYIISVAARILDMHPQTLRKYERVGLLSPSRTVGMLRLYSEEDVARLRLIKHLVGDLGLNLAGVQLALMMFNVLMRVRGRMDGLAGGELRAFLKESLDEMMDLLHARIS